MMHATTLSFANLHQHGELFANIFRARKESFIVRNQWDLPETMGMEYDQYDTPQSRWLAVHDDAGQVLAGMRLTPTTAQCGIYSYMIRDAQAGLLPSIPPDLLFEDAPCHPDIWEVTRGFIVQDLSAAARLKVRMHLVLQLLRAADEERIKTLIALLPSNWDRWGGRSRLDIRPAGRQMKMGGTDYQAVWIDISTDVP